MLTSYNIVYLFTNGFDIYVVFRFMRIFFGNNYKSTKMLSAMFVFKYLLSSYMFIFVSYPSYYMVFNLLGIFLIALCYKSRITKQITATAALCLVMVSSEIILLPIVGITGIDLSTKGFYGSSFTLIVEELIQFLLVLFFERFKNIKQDNQLPWYLFFIDISIPIASTFFLFQLILQEQMQQTIYITSTILCLALNFVVFFIYDVLSREMTIRQEAELSKMETLYFHNEAQHIQNSAEELRRFRHDVKNHFLALEQLIKANRSEQALKYLSNITERLNSTVGYSTTNNIEIDSIVNYKLSLATNEDILVSSNISIPQNFDFNADDLVTILGNLLDNAKEACEKIQNNKFIKIDMKYDRGSLIISVINSFDGKPNIHNNSYLTTKSDIELHGIGIRSIKKTVEKYDGLLSISHTNNEFSVHILLPLSLSSSTKKGDSHL